MKTNVRGGPRKGAGRPPLEFETKTISFRIRSEWEDIIKDTVKRKMKKLTMMVPKKKVKPKKKGAK